MTRKREYLFLQGVCSPFFTRLADWLEASGHRVHKVNFNAGDWLYWKGRPACNFRGRLESLREFLDALYRRLGITDQILFGDRRPIHRLALDHGRAHGVRTHVFEEGYFRPYWITLEREGVNGHSPLPRDPNWFLEVGHRLGEPGDGQAFQSSFGSRAMHDVAYHVAGIGNAFAFPHYRTHAPVSAIVEYGGYVYQLPKARFRKVRDDAAIDRWIHKAQPYFLLPLQLGSDAQILDHSRFDDMIAVMDRVITSFAKFAPNETGLLIKNHPLDTGQVNYWRFIQALAGELGVANRVGYVETGDLHQIIRHARGTVTVNSTVGALALQLNCPTIALGAPIYQLPGLTFQGDLDEFWKNPCVPDAELFRCFRNTVIHATQVNGGFYSREGIDLAVENSGRVLESHRSPLEELL